MEWKIDNSKYGEFGEMSEYEGKTIYLLTKKELHQLQENQPDTLLINIFGKVRKAEGANDDIRGGFVAFGKLEDIK